MKNKLTESVVDYFKNFYWENTKIYESYSFLRRDVPRFFKNFWKFRKALYNHYWFDHHGLLMFVETALEDMSKNIEEKGYDEQGKCRVSVDPRYFRPTEVETLLGDASKARDKLGWLPRTSFRELVSEMVREDLKTAERDELIKRHGYSAADYYE